MGCTESIPETRERPPSPTNYHSLSKIPDPDIFGHGWKLVRHKIFDGKPFQATDNLAGTDFYGMPDGNPFSSRNWSMRYSHMEFDQFLFTTWNYKVWAIITRDSIEKRVRERNCNEIRADYIKTYNRNEPHQKNGCWFNGKTHQPWITANELSKDFSIYKTNPGIKPMVMYCQPKTHQSTDNGYTCKEWVHRYKNKTSFAWPVGGGINIFVRDSSRKVPYTAPEKQRYPTPAPKTVRPQVVQHQREMKKIKEYDREWISDTYGYSWDRSYQPSSESEVEKVPTAPINEASNNIKKQAANYYVPEECVDHFVAVTQADRETATYYLKAARNDLTEAVKKYYNSEKVWYGYGGKEYETGPFDKIFVFKKEVEHYSSYGSTMEPGVKIVENSYSLKNPVGRFDDQWYFCIASPEGQHEKLGRCLAKFRKGENKCYFTLF